MEVDRRDLGGGVKNWEWIKKGVPIRVEIGPRDLEKNSVAVSRRDQPVKAKEFMPIATNSLRTRLEMLDVDPRKSFRPRAEVSRCKHARDR